MLVTGLDGRVPDVWIYWSGGAGRRRRPPAGGLRRPPRGDGVDGRPVGPVSLVPRRALRPISDTGAGASL